MEIELAILECFFSAPPPQFEAPQPEIGEISSAEVQLLDTSGCEKPDRFPDDQIIRSQILRSQIGGGKFVKNLVLP